MNGIIKVQQLPSQLASFYLTEQSFWNRFIRISRFQDPFVRVYDVCRDKLSNNNRVAVKDYCSNTNEQCQDVLMNLMGYRSIQQIEEICKLVAFCQEQETGDIRAAFQYRDQSLLQLIQKRYCLQHRKQFYLFIFKQVLFAIQSFKNIGVILEQIVLTNILVYKCESYFRIKVLYDQRQKKYDKIQQGIKAFSSANSINIAIKQIKLPDNNNCQQAIFQLGLLLLDIMFEYESLSSNNQLLKGNQSLNNYLYKSYLIFQNHEACHQNTNLINFKMDYLFNLNAIFIRQILIVIRKMLTISQNRIGLQRLIDDVEHLFQDKDSHNNQIQLQKPWFEGSDKEISPIKSKQSSNKVQDSLKYSDSHNSPKHLKKAIISQSTVGTANFLSISNKSQTQTYYFPKQNKIDFFVIPKDKLLQVNCHYEIKKKLQLFLIQLQNKVNLTKKDYYDNNVYFGEIDATSQKRNGLGIYVYSHGDVYFGLWKDNMLVKGIYIFKNAECFEGLVKNGKQGRGKYYYSNGNIYEGEWLDDMKHGLGKMEYSNGQSYDGMWSKGKKNGQGAYFYKDGTIFRGNFTNGKKQGFGIIDFYDGTRIQAYWQANQVEGAGKVFYKNGDYFQGIFNFSQKHGRGSYKWDEKTLYEGQFRKDMMQGQGRIKFGQNQIYQGHIKNGLRQGQGYYKYTNGDEFRGQWRKDEKYLGHYKFINGNSFEGKFKKGQISHGVMIYTNGQTYEGQFINGMRNGKGSYRDNSGALKLQGRWQNDRFISNI